MNLFALLRTPCDLETFAAAVAKVKPDMRQASGVADVILRSEKFTLLGPLWTYLPASSLSHILDHAASKGATETVVSALKHGADPQAKHASAWRLAIHYGHTALTAMLEARIDPMTWDGMGLIQAAGGGHLIEVERLATLISPDVRGGQALRKAIEKEHQRVISYLRPRTNLNLAAIGSLTLPEDLLFEPPLVGPAEPDWGIADVLISWIEPQARALGLQNTVAAYPDRLPLTRIADRERQLHEVSATTPMTPRRPRA